MIIYPLQTMFRWSLNGFSNIFITFHFHKDCSAQKHSVIINIIKMSTSFVDAKEPSKKDSSESQTSRNKYTSNWI